MARVSFKMTEAPGFSKDLIDLREDLKKRAEAVHRRTAINVVRRAKALAPDDPATSEDLKSVITYAGKGLKWIVGLDDKQFRGRGGTAAHQTPEVYGVWYEYGFKTRHIETRPYMRPAADAEEADHWERMSDVVDASLRGGS